MWTQAHCAWANSFLSVHIIAQLSSSFCIILSVQVFSVWSLCALSFIVERKSMMKQKRMYNKSQLYRNIPQMLHLFFWPLILKYDVFQWVVCVTRWYLDRHNTRVPTYRSGATMATFLKKKCNGSPLTKIFNTQQHTFWTQHKHINFIQKRVETATNVVK